MTTVLFALALAIIIAAGLLLAALRTGVRQQQRAGSLDSQPPGLSAALARHVFGLHAHLPRPTASHAPPSRRAEGELASAPGNDPQATP